MRLDVYLVKAGFFKTRQKAKEAIKRGLVLVNGKVVRKPSMQVFKYEQPDKINVLEPERPKGYWKLKKIDKELGILSKNDTVLDLGSSAGGFLIYASEICKKVIGVEYSLEFEEELKNIKKTHKNVEVLFDDVFKMDVSKLPTFDVILDDLTTTPENSAKALSRFICKLRKGGRVLFVAKGVKIGEFNWEKMGLDSLKPVGMCSFDKKEVYVKLIKIDTAQSTYFAYTKHSTQQH